MPGRRPGLIGFQRDDGGVWQLDIPPRIRVKLGQRVRITAVRADFDILDVMTVTVLAQPPAPVPVADQ